MKILFFAQGNREIPSARTRVYMIHDRLSKYGVSSETYHVKSLPWWEVSQRRVNNFLQNLKALWSAKDEDVIYLHRTIHQWDFIILVLFFRLILRKEYVFDFDDFIFKGKPFKSWLLVTLSSKLVVGSHFLREYVKGYKKDTKIIPTSVDTDTYAPSMTENLHSDDNFIIGWVGGSTHYENLKIIVPVLKKLVSDGYSFTFKMLGPEDGKIKDLFCSIESLSLDYVSDIDWTNTREVVEHIQGFDVGLMPLKENAFNKGKCAFKAIEYMACGVPAIVSNVGENNYLIDNEKNGFIVSNEVQAWNRSIVTLFNEDELQEIGGKAQLTIRRSYSYRANIPKLLQFIQQ